MWDALRIASFRKLWFGMLFSMAAVQMTIIARAWLAFDLTGSGVAIGLVALSRGLPRFFLAPLGGAAADRFDKRRTLIAVQVIRCVLALATAVLVSLGVIQIWHLMVIGVIQGTTAPFTLPTRTALILDLVGGDKLANGIALDSAARDLNRVLAPALTGVLLAWSPALAFYAVAAFYVLAALAMFRLPLSVPAAPRAESVLADVAGGFGYVWKNRRVLALIAMAFLIAMLGMPYRQILPVFQQDVLGVGPTALGLMYTAVGIGAVLSSLALAYISDSPRKHALLVGSGLAFGVSLAAFAITTNYALGLALLGVVGFSSHSFLTLNKTLMMLNTDRALLGRVMSIYMMSFSLVPLALLPMGAMVDRIGAPITIAAAGLLLALVIATTAALRPPPRT